MLTVDKKKLYNRNSKINNLSHLVYIDRFSKQFFKYFYRSSSPSIEINIIWSPETN